MKGYLFRTPWIIVAAFCVAALLCAQADEYDELNCKAKSTEDSENDHGQDTTSGCPDTCYTWEVVPGYEYCEGDDSASNCAFCIKRLEEDNATLKWYYAECSIVDDQVTPYIYECVNQDANPYSEEDADEVYTETGTDCERCDESTGEPIGE